MNWPCVTVMPVYNEAECVEAVCREWIEQMVLAGGALLVVNDGSTDETPRILERMAAAESRLIVVSQANGGHGAAVLNGYRRALELQPEWVFQVDSDGEMPARCFPEIWAWRDRCGFALGWRSGREKDWVRFRLSLMHQWMMGLLFGVKVRDPNIPFRLMNAEQLRSLLARLPAGVFAPNVFLALLAAKDGALVDGPEVPVAPRAGGVASIRGWRTLALALRCTGELIRFRLNEWRG